MGRERMDEGSEIAKFFRSGSSFVSVVLIFSTFFIILSSFPLSEVLHSTSSLLLIPFHGSLLWIPFTFLPVIIYLQRKLLSGRISSSRSRRDFVGEAEDRRSPSIPESQELIPAVVELEARCLAGVTWLEAQEMAYCRKNGSRAAFTVLLADWASASSYVQALLGPEGLGSR